MLVLTIAAPGLPLRAAPLETSILTVRDELLPSPTAPGRAASPRAPVQFDTPPELSAIDPAYQFQTSLPGLDFDEVKAFLLRPESRTWIGSDASRIEMYHLGPVNAAAPPLPGWARAFGRHAAWSRASAAATGPQTPFINRAQAVWSVGDPLAGDSRGEFLFRARFDLPELAPLAYARLHLGLRADLLDLRINDRPVVTPPGVSGLLDPIEITELLQPGSNIIGLHLRNPGPPAVAHPSFAFTIEYAEGHRSGIYRSPAYDQAWLSTRQGDQVRGWIMTFNPVSVLMQTPYGRYGVDWKDVESIVFPRGWFEPPLEPAPFERRVSRFFGRVLEDGRGAIEAIEPTGVPVSAVGHPEGGVLLRDHRFLEDELLGLEGDRLQLRRRDTGEAYAVDRRDIAALYPPRPDPLHVERPSTAFSELKARVRTIHGETYSGILRQVGGRRIVIEHTGDGMLSLNPAEVVWVWFPRHRDPAQPAFVPLMESEGGSAALRGRRIAILSMPSPGQPLSAAEKVLQAQVQRAGFLIGWDCAYPEPALLLDSAQFNPRAYPVAIVASPGGRYPDSYRAPGDLRERMVQYVEAGGTLLVYARDGALEVPLRLDDGPAPGAEALLGRRLNLLTLAPGQEGSHTERGFSHPPNLPVAFYMNRAAAVGPGLGSLPLTIDVPNLAEASYRPVVSADGRHEALYQLVDESGRVFGPALTVTRHGAGRIVLIHHLLWVSSTEGRPFAEVGLPQLLAWAAGRP